MNDWFLCDIMLKLYQLQSLGLFALLALFLGNRRPLLHPLLIIHKYTASFDKLHYIEWKFLETKAIWFSSCWLWLVDYWVLASILCLQCGPSKIPKRHYYPSGHNELLLKSRVSSSWAGGWVWDTTGGGPCSSLPHRWVCSSCFDPALCCCCCLFAGLCLRPTLF